MSFVKSDLIKELADNYPNFLRKDLIKLLEIMIYEMQESLKRGERVELRDFGIWSTNIQKPRISRNPKTGEKVHTRKKVKIHFKMAKELFNKLNNEK